MQCPDCSKQYTKIVSLSMHYRRAHEKTAQDLFEQLFLNGIRPTCKCGCGNITTFLDITRGFREYIRGHAARVNNNFQTNKAKANSIKTRKRMIVEGTWKPFCLSETGSTWNKGLTKETDKRLAQMSSRMKEPEKNKELSERFRRYRLDGTVRTLRGKEHSQWNGGVSPLSISCNSDRRLYNDWKYPILVAANFTCQKCGRKNEKGNSTPLHVHHDKLKFATIVHLVAEQNGWEEVYTLSTKADDLMLQALKAKIVSEVTTYHIQNNVSGLVLCKSCHKALHNKLNF